MTPAFLRAEAKTLRERARATMDIAATRELFLLARELERLAAEIDGKTVDGQE